MGSRRPAVVLPLVATGALLATLVPIRIASRAAQNKGWTVASGIAPPGSRSR